MSLNIPPDTFKYFIGAGDNFAAFILNELVTTGKITKEVLKKAHYFASAYCLENKNI